MDRSLDFFRFSILLQKFWMDLFAIRLIQLNVVDQRKEFGERFLSSVVIASLFSEYTNFIG